MIRLIHTVGIRNPLHPALKSYSRLRSDHMCRWTRWEHVICPRRRLHKESRNGILNKDRFRWRPKALAGRRSGRQVLSGNLQSHITLVSPNNDRITSSVPFCLWSASPNPSNPLSTNPQNANPSKYPTSLKLASYLDLRAPKPKSWWDAERLIEYSVSESVFLTRELYGLRFWEATQ